MDEFLDRFGLLAGNKEQLFRAGEETAVISQIIAEAKLDGWQMGKTKVFLRAGQMAVLDMMRHKRLNSAATAIQKEVRCYQKRKEFLAFRRAIIVVAKWSRGMLARRLATGRGFRSSTSHLDVSRFCRQRPPDISRKKCSHQGEMWTSVSPLVVRRVGEECDECACSGSLCIFIFPMS